MQDGKSGKVIYIPVIQGKDEIYYGQPFYTGRPFNQEPKKPDYYILIYAMFW